MLNRNFAKNQLTHNTTTNNKLRNIFKFGNDIESSNTSPKSYFNMPSVWLGSYPDKNQYDMDETFHAFKSIILEMDDSAVKSIKPFEITAYCEICKKVTTMKIFWNVVGRGTLGFWVSWTEDIICQECQCGSRQRALIDFLDNRVLCGRSDDAGIYISEAVTPTYAQMKKRYKNVIGSEFLGDGKKGGNIYEFQTQKIRHEDLTELSFKNRSLDVVITQGVFEHVPNYKKSFEECYRVLKDTGVLLFTVPFTVGNESTQIRATVDEKGEITHLFPPELHGDPVNSDGVLCFQNFGWDLLDCLRQCGFKNAVVNFYWGVWKGYIGGPYTVFSACKK